MGQVDFSENEKVENVTKQRNVKGSTAGAVYNKNHNLNTDSAADSKYVFCISSAMLAVFLLLFTAVFLFVFVPLPDAELSGHAVGLILNHIRHKVWTQLHVGPSVAAHIVVVGGREQSEDLSGGDDKGFRAASRHLNITTSVIVRYFECVCELACEHTLRLWQNS